MASEFLPSSYDQASYASLFRSRHNAPVLQQLGDSLDTLRQLLAGQHAFSSQLAAAQQPIVVLGAAALAGPEGAQLLALTQQLAQQLRARATAAPDGWRVLSVLQRVASQAAALDLGYRPGAAAARGGQAKALLLLGADEGVVERSDLAQNATVIYIGGCRARWLGWRGEERSGAERHCHLYRWVPRTVAGAAGRNEVLGMQIFLRN